MRVGDQGFVSESTLEAWLRTGEVERAGALMTSRSGRRFVLRDAVRILGRRDAETDPYGLTGRVESLRDFLRQGAAISGNSLRLGAGIYDIEYGFIAVPMASADESGTNPRVG
jgi:hypothetical protein